MREIIATKNQITKKRNIFTTEQLSQIRWQNRLEYIRQIKQIWKKDRYHFSTLTLTLSDREKEIKRWLAKKTERHGWKYIVRTETDKKRQTAIISADIFVPVPAEVKKVKKEYEKALAELKARFAIVKNDAEIPDTPEEPPTKNPDKITKITMSRPPVSAQVINVLPYLKYAGVDVLDVAEGRASVGWVEGRKEIRIGKDKDKIPMAKGKVYVHLADTDTLVVIPRAQKIRCYPEPDRQKQEEVPTNPKPTLNLFIGPAGTGKTTKMMEIMRDYPRKSKKFFLTLTGMNATRLQKKSEDMQIQNAKAMTVDSFLRAVPSKASSKLSKRYGLSDLIRNGLEPDIVPPEDKDIEDWECVIGIDEIFLLSEDQLKELVKLWWENPYVVFHATGDPTGQKKRIEYEDIKKIFNIFEIRLKTVHRPKAQKIVLTRKNAKRKVLQALSHGKIVVGATPKARRKAKRIAGETPFRLNTKNAHKINLSAPAPALEHISERTREIATIFVPNGAVVKQISKHLFETEKGIVRFSSTEQNEVLDIPVLSVTKAQGLEADEVVFVVLPQETIKRVDFSVVVTRAMKKLYICVLTDDTNTGPPPPHMPHTQ